MALKRSRHNAYPSLPHTQQPLYLTALPVVVGPVEGSVPEGPGREETDAVGPDSRGGAVDEGPGCLVERELWMWDQEEKRPQSRAGYWVAMWQTKAVSPSERQ